MAKWFYYNERGEKIEVTGGQLKGLAKAGMITPGTLVETEDGKKGRAGKVKGLTFTAAVQPETENPESATQEIDPHKSTPPDEAKIYGLAQSEPPLDEENPFVIPIQEEIAPFTAATSGAVNPFTSESIEENSFAVSAPVADDMSTTTLTERTFGVGDYLWIIFVGYLLDPSTKAKVENMTSEQKSTLMRWRIGVAIAFFVMLLLLVLPFTLTNLIAIVAVLVLLAVLFPFIHAALDILRSKKQSRPSASQTSSPPVNEIKKLKKLLDDGAITQEEFDAFKKKTLDI